MTARRFLLANLAAGAAAWSAALALGIDRWEGLDLVEQAMGLLGTLAGLALNLLMPA
jgi:hypothetical protein